MTIVTGPKGFTLLAALLLTAVMSSLLFACGGGNRADLSLGSRDRGLPPVAATPGITPSLPDLDAMAATKVAAATDADRFRLGSDYLASQPNFNLQVNGTQLLFSPQWSAPGQVSSAGLAVFEFAAADMAGPQDLTLNWTDQPKDYQNLFLGLSNYSKGRWEWVQGSPAALALANIADFQAPDGRVFVVVLLLGNQTAELGWMRLGGNLLPKANLSVLQNSGTAPFLAQFNAGSSFDLDGTIAAFDWDFDGDANFDLLGGSAQESHNYSLPGVYSCVVRVSDNSGGQDTSDVTVQVLTPGGPPVAKLIADYLFVDAGDTVRLDASSSAAPAGLAKYEWDTDGDSVYETDTGLSGTLDWVMPDAQLHTVGVRVTDTLSQTDTATLQLQGDGPGYDEVENNDSFDAGNVLPGPGLKGYEGNLGDTGSYDGDLDDWYSVQIAEPMSVQFNMYFIDAEADLDFRLFEADGTSQLASSTGTADNERMTYSFTVPGNYCLRCYRFGSTASSADYQLELKRLIAPSVSLGADVTSGDIPLPVTFTATASDQDGTVDNYRWDFNGDGTYEYNSGTSAVTSNTFTSVGTRNVSVRVTDNDGATATASVTITTSVTYDEIENNDSSAAAQQLPAYNFSGFIGNIGIGGGLDGDESDWYKFNASPGDEICAVLRFAGGEADVDLRLLDADGSTELLASSGTDDDEYVSFVAASAGPYFLEVMIKGSASLRGPTDYILSMLEFGLSESEPNETYDTGNNLPALPVSMFGGALEANSGSQEPHDWYKLVIAGAGTRTVWCRFIDDQCDVDMKLFGTDGTSEVGSSTGTDNEERIIYNFPAAGTYYVKIYNYALGPANYIVQAE